MEIRIEIAGREFGFNNGAVWYESSRHSFFWKFGAKPMLNAQVEPVYTIGD